MSESVVQDVRVLLSEDDVAAIDDGFKVVQSPTDVAPGLAVKRRANDEEGTAVVEFAVAFGPDDIAPGFRAAGPSLHKLARTLQENLQKEKDQDEEKSGQAEGSDESKSASVSEDEILLCVRDSSDPLELGKCAVTTLRFLDAGVSSMDGFEAVALVADVLSLGFRTVASAPLPEAVTDEAAEDEQETKDGSDESKGAESSEPSAESKQAPDNSDDEDDDDDEDGEWQQQQQQQQQQRQLEETDGAFEQADKLEAGALDGELGECILPSAESKSNELEEAERRAQAARIAELIEKARAEKETLTQANGWLQRDLVLLIEAKKAQHKSEPGSTNDLQSPPPDHEGFDQETEQKYKNALSAYRDARDTLHRTQDSYDGVAMQLQSKLDVKEKKCDEIQSSFAHFKREIAKQAENSRSGRPIPIHIIDQFESAERSKAGELEKIRLRNLHLRAELNKLEKALQNKERLADGLHLIDFEQLKIENQALSEKIEERNEDLAKLNKKTTTTVQVLTHLKEKLVFVQSEAVQLGDELKILDKELQASRDQLNQSKRQRDQLRSGNNKKRESQGFFKSTLLVEDFRKRTQELKALKRSIQDLQQKHANLTGFRDE